MKLAEISVLNQKPAYYFLISEPQDLIDYQFFLNNEMGKSIVRVMKSQVPPDRWNHILRRENHGDSVLMHSYLKSHIEGSSPLLNAPLLSQQKIDTIKKYLLQGKEIIINKRGGWCFFDHNSKLISLDEYIPVSDNIYHVGKNTKIINFENDPKLEKRTLEYFKEQGDKDPSYILNLREHSQKEITNILNEFYQNNGTTVYVYTTGLDVPQMYEYSQAIIDSSIQHVVFEFNSGITQEHYDVVEFLKNNNVIVDII